MTYVCIDCVKTVIACRGLSRMFKSEQRLFFHQKRNLRQARKYSNKK